jgi:hypothetical protein
MIEMERQIEGWSIMLPAGKVAALSRHIISASFAVPLLHGKSKIAGTV